MEKAREMLKEKWVANIERGERWSTEEPLVSEVAVVTNASLFPEEHWEP